jgi:hypothetical protein
LGTISRFIARWLSRRVAPNEACYQGRWSLLDREIAKESRRARPRQSNRQRSAGASEPALGNGGIGMMVRGSIDVVTCSEVSGWAFAAGRREPVLVQAILNHEILGEAIANTPRPDLAAAGLGDGNSGYVIKLLRPIDPMYLPFIVVKIDRGDAELPRAPVLGFGEFFSALHAAHPTAGRSRSVFGGLWTDRTDAVALLRGKTEIGQIAPATAASVAQLIYDGLALLDLRETPSQLAWRDDLSEKAGDIAEEVLPVLRAVLEDNPLVVQADWVEDGNADFSQPSAANPSPSPAECVEVIVPFGESVVLDVVRDSHRLPEFTPLGVSRWATRAPSEAVKLVNGHGLLDSRSLGAGQAAVVGPGTLFRVRSGAGSAAVRILCLPGRGLPFALATDRVGADGARASGVRVWA